MYKVKRAAPFVLLLAEIKSDHPKIEEDLAWIEGRLAQNPIAIGDRVPNLKSVLPVFKTRCKDSCCNLGARGGWRLYYRVDKPAEIVETFFISHKREAENLGVKYLDQMIERAFQ